VSEATPHERFAPTWADLLAGVTVVLILIPQSMAYAELAGMPAHRGLYAAAIAPVMAAFFASSPWLQTGPTALTSLLTFGALSHHADVRAADYVSLAALLALVVGVTRVAIGLLHAGAITYLMSHAVLRGFTLGAAILICASQVPSLLGVVPEVPGVLPGALWTLAHPGLWDEKAFGFVVLTAGLVMAGRSLHPLFPGLLIAVVTAVLLADRVGFTGPQVGAIPSDLPTWSIALPWQALPELALPGLVIALVGFAEAASISQTFAERTRRPWDPNREFVSQGMANFGAGLFGGFPVGGSFGRSALNHLAGAQTRWAGGITGLVVLAVLPVAFLLAPLPKAVLGAAIVTAVWRLLAPGPLLELWRLSVPQAVIGTLTFALTLALAPRIELAVISGIALSIAVHLWREREQRVESHIFDGCLTLRPVGVMWFGSAPGFRRSLATALDEHPSTQRLRVDLSGLGRLDLSGALVLRDALAVARRRGVPLQFTRVPRQIQRVLKAVYPDLPIAEQCEQEQRAMPRPSQGEVSMPITAKELVAAAKASISTCSIEAAVRRMREEPSALVLDVREPAEHAAGSVPGAELVPRGLLEGKIAELCDDPQRPILVYCAAGNRAALATKTLLEMGYPNAICIDGSVAELLEAAAQEGA